ncbi:D-isomer specific 2-hydroxyacid dehydrogenase NAD-binding protein [Companilactobacillus paralimentarius DSM 13238 = JCM 10415]|jgi:Phosphoglycerate dehydrogenase and related dehydrogenases|uniref:D-isomer specific 2-hydroxyacid dehydrogenase NAD-binding protein n=1 Tax=Companilactobacillus paralimentarius DSM 13238 = JCM 10415 TaxID=1122151 RepID=A0A0R1PBT3_9LACO|nr:D-2-hydroxyacid dehydrogenase [Companilactobacillus paralimentarius]KAE9563456.1 hydroxyacid dehydrogenase [Companilactobacillus paralimentarius]KRL29933.1 D-isomer specific 2-hydroxyacid dehydrogenase NAD-binding protein [Companilactobacillus paralimentarius DSM 13238 = JCM 10415]MDR4932416.1 D-2-hydroxyacid dehydrogenase [Companilactobacillus paralimentarius]QFR69038.1 D-2-hydroxyacid dehydrogenase [Companilactobacillus paralimentarius]
MKVLSLVNLTKKQREKIESISNIDLQVVSPKQVTPEDLDGVEVLYDWSNTLKDAVVKSETLNWIQVVRAGVDALPLPELNNKGVILTNGSGANAINIAEQTLAYMLMFVRRMNLTARHQDAREWKHDEGYDEVYNKTVMIVGVGHIGTLIAKYAKALGMKTIGVRHSDKPAEYIDEMIPMSELSNRINEVHFVINALPDTDETLGIFNKDLFDAMSKKAYYINIGRGKTTNMDDLVEALNDEAIAGAALDVTTPEPLPSDSPLWDMKNVIITPHDAGASVHYEERAFDIFKRNLKSYVENGEVVENVVNYSLGY